MIGERGPETLVTRGMMSTMRKGRIVPRIAKAPALHRGCCAALVGLSLLAVGCAKKPPPEPTIATVDGQPVTQAFFEQYVLAKSGVPPDRIDTGLKARLLDDLLRLEAAAAAGAKETDPRALSLAEIARLESLAHSAAEAQGVFEAPSDADLQAEYQKYVSELPASEFHAAHILVASENAAALAVTQLQGGADFAAVAAQVSLDESKSRGGDLGWIRPGHLPNEFFDTLKTLKPGEFTPQPFKTAYGWHVLKLMETRAASPPAFEDVKAQLAANLQQERYRRFLEQSLAAAKVERSSVPGSK